MKNLLKNLEVPQKKIDAVLDTDAYNEVDDQFALMYMLKSDERINVRAIYAAPFYNKNSASPADGMKKSYDEILNVLEISGYEQYKNCVFRGSEHYMTDENTPVPSDAMNDLTARARKYSPENPLYVICIAAITNVASAIAAAPDIAENIVIVWLGGHDINNNNACREFNMMQDIAAARVIFRSAAPVVQLPCLGVVSGFAVSKNEFDFWLKGKNKICDYLVDIVMSDQHDPTGRVWPWSRIIWDVTAVAWLLNDGEQFMESVIMPCRIPEYDMNYACSNSAKLIRYVNYIHRDALFEDLIKKLTK